ncbi:SHOCT domain-containing protein [Streptomyces sp. NPDC015139]|uniref:SHOCT domain-containing protein n=1 Tax=Streptomyces sp. NPDC015139 TaxID=3364942 RepID=UPI0036FEDA05
MFWYGGWGPGGWFLMLVTTLLFWALVVAAGVALVRHLSASPRGRQAAPPWEPGDPRWDGRRAEELLAERFARGQIDEEEYERRLALLREHR